MPVIGQGYSAQVVDVSKMRVAKIFRRRASHLAPLEFAALKRAHAAGVPVPQPVRLRDARDRSALIMDRVRGGSMYDHFLSRPGGGAALLLFGLRHMARLHAHINALGAPDLPAPTARIARAVRAADLPAAVRSSLLAPLDDPCPRRLCHGDLHLGNVMWSAAGPVVIDWTEACAGWPAYDAARSIILLRFGGGGGGDRARAVAAETYLHWYCAFSGLSRPEVRRWLPTAAAARLGGSLDDTRREALRGFILKAVS